MKKMLIFIGVAIAIYLVAAVVSLMLLPKKLADSNARLYGVRVAIAQLNQDQWVVSERLKEITTSTLGRGQGKIEQVTKILEDADLNHIARVYLGSDWSTRRSDFLGRVSHARKLINVQKNERDRSKSRLNEKIKELEARKKTLIHKIKSPSEERAWRVEMDDVERQLIMFRSSNTYREYIEKDDNDIKNIEAKAKNEDNLFRIANEFEAVTVGQLTQTISERLAKLRWEENEPVRIQMAASVFNIWPLNVFFKIPVGEEEYEKRL